MNARLSESDLQRIEKTAEARGFTHKTYTLQMVAEIRRLRQPIELAVCPLLGRPLRSIITNEYDLPVERKIA